jgi:hypothetical protein
MSNTTGGPAFPGVDYINQRGKQNPEGMTLRDYFAAKAMQGLLVATVTPITVWSQDDVAETAYNMADSMLKARKA